MAEDVRWWPICALWARKFYEDPTFDKDERDYKFEAVRPLVEAREALLRGGEWRPSLRAGFLNSNNNPPFVLIRATWRSSTT